MNRLIVSAWLLMLLQPMEITPFEAVFCAPELFGCGRAEMIAQHPPVGVVTSGMGVWVFAAHRVDNGYAGAFLQIAGQPVGDYDEFGGEYIYRRPVPFGIYPRSDDRFSGWIEFRTHKRPFCGAPSLDNMPSCRSYKQR